MSNLETLKRHPRIKEVSVEDGGDLLFVYLKPGWGEVYGPYEWRTSRAFDAFDVPSVNHDELTIEENAARALRWVREDTEKMKK